MEDKASSIIDELINLGMLERNPFYYTLQQVPSCPELCDEGVDRKDIAIDSPIRLYIVEDGTNSLSPNLNTLPITSLFLRLDESQPLVFKRDPAYVRSIFKLNSLVVLELKMLIACLPDEIGDLVHLKYLDLWGISLTELPTTMGKLQNLQTFRLWVLGRALHELPVEFFDIQSLRHLIFELPGGLTIDSEIRESRKIGTMKNLRTLFGLRAGGGVAEELSKLTQLRRLHIQRISEDNAGEMSASIMKMTNLIELSLEAELEEFGLEKRQRLFVQLFPEMGTFDPPPKLQEVKLNGQLVEVPHWLLSMQNLTKLTLVRSDLPDNPTSEIQFLPKLKHLALHNAFREKRIDEEFCVMGGFPSLETLQIQSDVLVEWTAIARGSFPRLESLTFGYCPDFKFFPIGLENISTLKNLLMGFIHGDLERPLKREENYKIKNIPNVRIRSR